MYLVTITGEISPGSLLIDKARHVIYSVEQIC